MAEIINLRRARKAKARQEAGKQAAENRAAFGRTKAERKSGEANAALQARQLDGHLLETPARKPGGADEA